MQPTHSKGPSHTKDPWWHTGGNTAASTANSGTSRAGAGNWTGTRAGNSASASPDAGTVAGPTVTNATTLGASVDVLAGVDRSVLVAGAPGARVGVSPSAGRAFVFERPTGGVWALQRELTPTTLQPTNAGFGE